MLRHRTTAAAVTAGALAIAGFAVASPASAAPIGHRGTHSSTDGQVTLVVRVADTASFAGAVAQLRRAGATILAQAPALHLITVRVPMGKIHRLAKVPGVQQVGPSRTAKAQSLGFNPTAYPGAMTNVTRVTKAQELWKKGITGKGVDVAIIDTGIAPVPSLNDATKVVVGPDLSISESTTDTRYLDTYGHGTAMAGIIAGRETNNNVSTTTPVTTTTQSDTMSSNDYPYCPSGVWTSDGWSTSNGTRCVVRWGPADRGPKIVTTTTYQTTTTSTGGASTGPAYAQDTQNYYGMAPDARLVNLKLADQNGVVDVTQMIAAINWVVQNKNANGLNIRVLNLSYGTESPQSPQFDPLSFAAEQAWKAGIVVVASAGNDGGRVDGLANPAYNPWVLAVGATDTRGTDALSDDTIPTFSARQGGNWGSRPVDVVAPGVGIISPGVPGSYLWDSYSSARVGNDFFRGSGTSQAAAVVSGGVALLLQNNPGLTPNQVKAILQQSAKPVPNATKAAQGFGQIDLLAATSANPALYNQNNPNGNGLGSVESARGGVNITIGNATLQGEMDVMGNQWDSGRFAQATQNKTSWGTSSATTPYLSGAGSTFLGVPWFAGAGFSTDTSSWAGRTWSGRTWSGRTWSGAAWTTGTWSGRTWSGRTWSGRTWSGASWSSPVVNTNWASSIWAGAGWN